MVARVFRCLAPALAALGVLALRPAVPGGLSATPPLREGGEVVFRHYL